MTRARAGASRGRFSQPMGGFHVGTSGWSYPDWRGRFYPADLPADAWLAHYQERFAAVELNASFYRLPNEMAFLRWGAHAPDGFRFAVKGWRRITHMRRLRDARGDLREFCARVRLLGTHLGPLLWQLPPNLAPDQILLQGFLDALPDDLQHAIEFRDPRWWTMATWERLCEHGVSFVLHDRGTAPTPRVVTARTVYVRFHGTEEGYAGSYDARTLRTWARRIAGFLGEGCTVWCFFNNTADGAAPANAERLADLVALG
ncbi:MAG: DUF72 domain-containing protein [Planctomycetes bacterium]|nr:DUF72 domain-containing protein [Planctomycetota bacterium]